MHTYLYRLGRLAVCGCNIPILDRMTQSSDPYLRLELYPRQKFPLKEFPPQTTTTRRQSLNPQWKEAFQFLIPEVSFLSFRNLLALNLMHSLY